MAAPLLALGDTALPSAWTTLAAGARAYLILFGGGDSASLHIEAKYGDGADDAAPMGLLYRSSNSSRAVEPMIGPLTFRVRRDAGVTAGCAIETGDTPGGGS